MKTINAFLLFAILALAGWQLLGVLSDDALGMAVGILFGAVVSIPTALLVIAATRRPERSQAQQKPPEPQPPVLVMQGEIVDEVPQVIEQRRRLTVVNDWLD